MTMVEMTSNNEVKKAKTESLRAAWGHVLANLTVVGNDPFDGSIEYKQERITQINDQFSTW